MAGQHRNPIEPRRYSIADKWNAAAFFAEYGLILAFLTISLSIMLSIQEAPKILYVAGCVLAVILAAASPGMRGKLRKHVSTSSKTGTGRTQDSTNEDPARHRTAQRV